MTTAYEALLERAGDAVTSRGPRESMVRCPCLDHDDSTASLHVSVGDRACAVVWCHAECSTPDVMAAWGLPEAALYDAYWNRSNGNGPQKVWIYTDETGEPLFEVGRFAGKKFLQRRPGKTDWRGGIKGVRRVLYRLPEVIAAAQAGRVVFVVEGEKDADALRLAGEVATTSPAGAGKWRQEYAESLRGARVVVVADKDGPGRKHAQRVAASLNGVASAVTVVEALEGKDASDHLDAGHSVGAFVKVAVADEPETGPKPAVKAPETGALLTSIWQFVARFVVLPGPAEYRAIALFAAHTWAFEAAHATPYIVVESPEKQSGKTRLLEVLELVCRGAMKVASISAAGLFQTIGDGHPTLLIDEADAIFAGNTDRNEDLRGVLNAGNAPGSKVIRGGKDGKPVSYEVYCPKVIAGIGTGRLPDTIRDRAIVVPIDRKLRSERVERLRRRLLQAELDTLRAQLAAWAELHHDRLYRYELRAPLEKISDRLEEAWEPLLAIAELAGGEWPETAIAAAEDLAGEGDDDATASHTLLVALRDVFGEREVLSTREILDALNEDDELPFGAWNDGKGITPRELGRLLKRYRVKPRSVRQADGSIPRGYRREQFESVWERYGGLFAPTSATTATQSQNQGVSYPPQTSFVADSEQAASPHEIRDVADVGDKTRPTGSDGVCGTCGGVLTNVNGELVCFGCEASS